VDLLTAMSPQPTTTTRSSGNVDAAPEPVPEMVRLTGVDLATTLRTQLGLNEELLSELVLMAGKVGSSWTEC
jgi:hypothetical protein